MTFCRVKLIAKWNSIVKSVDIEKCDSESKSMVEVEFGLLFGLRNFPNLCFFPMFQSASWISQKWVWSPKSQGIKILLGQSSFGDCVHLPEVSCFLHLHLAFFFIQPHPERELVRHFIRSKYRCTQGTQGTARMMLRWRNLHFSFLCRCAHRHSF